MIKRFLVVLVLFGIGRACSQTGWRAVPSGTIQSLYGLAAESDSTGELRYAVGAHGTVLRSSDAGSTWKVVRDSPALSLYACSFFAPDGGYAVGEGNLTMKFFRDSLGNFSTVVSDPGNPASLAWWDVYAAPPSGRIVLLIGDLGLIYQSTNSGATFSYVNSGTTMNLKNSCVRNLNSIYLVGDSGTILKGDIAHRWSRQTPPITRRTSNYYGISFPQGIDTYATGFIVGEKGMILRTTDDGTIWNVVVNTPSVTLRGVFFPGNTPGFPGGAGWAVGDSGIVLRTDDAGLHWVRQPSGTSSNLNRVLFTDSLHGLIVGDNGTILETSTGGRSEPLFSALPAYTYFGQVVVGTVRRSALTIRNYGASPMVISRIESQSNDFTMFPESSEIPPFGSREFAIIFSPSAVGQQGSLITIHDNASGSPHSVFGFGKGIRNAFRSGWRWLNPLPQGNYLRDIAFLNGKGIAAGEAGTVMTSTDNGSSWTILSEATGTTQTLAAVSLIDDEKFVVVGENGAILVSSDGGKHWVPGQSGTAANLSSVSFSDRSNGFVSGSGSLEFGDYGSIHHTSDGGNVWTQQFSSPDITISGIRSLDASTAVAVGFDVTRHGEILRTSNRGDSWVSVPLPLGTHGSSGTSLRTVSFADRHLGIAGGSGGLLLRTTNGGSTWSRLGSLGENIVKLSFIGPSAVCAFGESGGFYRSSDTGSTWTQGRVSTRTILFSGAMASPLRGFALSGYDILIHYPYFRSVPTFFQTSDGGNVWSEFPGTVTLRDLRSISFEDALHGMAVGDSGIVLYTSDGGVNWTPQLHGTLLESAGIPLVGVSFPRADTATAVGGYGTIIHTTDGGLHWAAQVSGTRSRLSGTAFSDSYHGICVGAAGALLRTTDGGLNWFDESGAVSSNLNAVAYGSADHVVVVGDLGVVLVSSDGGRLWFQPSNVGTTAALLSVALAGETITAVSRSGTLVQSSDGGISWDVKDAGTNGSLNGISYLGRQGVIVGDGGIVLKSSDAGYTWSAQASGTLFSLLGCVIHDPLSATIVGTDGAILQTHTGGLWIGNTPRDYALEQNFPNPFNPTTVIRYSVPTDAVISLRIYDLLGRELATLAEGSVPAGTYDAQWRADHVSSGVYFYRLRAGGFVSTRKMMVVR